MASTFSLCRLPAIMLGMLGWGLSSSAIAQYSFVETPFNTAGHSYYENIGLTWGLQGRGWFFNFGGPGPGAAPAFGGFDPNAQATFGGGFGGSGLSGHFGLTAGQGSDSFASSGVSGTTVISGGRAFISDVQQRPFVLGFIPVVGGSEPVSPLKWRLERMEELGKSPGAGIQSEETAQPAEKAAGGASGKSSAERGDLSVAAIRAQQAAEEDATRAEVESLLDKARSLEEAGKPGQAKIYYKRAAQRAKGEQLQEIAAKIRELDKKSK